MLPRSNDIKVAIVEDDDSFRQHLVALIGGARGFWCLGSHRTAEAAIKHLPVEQPQVLLMDLQLPNTSGLELISKVAARWPEVAVVVLTVSNDTKRIFEALEAGAVGYLVKDQCSPARLLESITVARTGGSPVSSQIARLMVKRFQAQGRNRKVLDALTPREKEILEQFARGLRSNEIAEQLGISERTIGTHLRNIYAKLHVRSRTAAVARFLQQNV